MSFIVIDRKDVENYLSDEDQIQLSRILNTIIHHRECDSKEGTPNYLVCRRLKKG